MIDRILFWTIFKECAEQNGTLTLLLYDQKDSFAEIETGYHSLFSGLYILLNDEENSFTVKLTNTDPAPLQDRSWEFIVADRTAIEDHLTHKPEWKWEMDEHRISNSICTTFPITECTEICYKNTITDALPDIVFYLEVFKKYIRNISDLLIKADIDINRKSLMTNIKSTDNKNDNPYLINNFRSDKFEKTEIFNNIAELLISNGKLFNWNTQSLNKISEKDNQYIPNIDRNGYGIWIISRSNWTTSPIDEQAIKIYGKGKLIEEPVSAIRNNKTDDNDIRITFAKMCLRNGQFTYKFIGLFKKISCEQITTDGNALLINSYIIISNVYCI